MRLLSIFPILAFCIVAFLGMPALAQEKLNMGIGSKGWPQYDLIMVASEEQKLWEDNGLRAQWYSFTGGGMYRAAAAGSLDMGITDVVGGLPAILRGVPMVIVTDLGYKQHFFIWVKGESPLKVAGDLKGAKLGVSRLGDASHGYGQMIVRHLGLEKDIKFVAVGGLESRLAALKSGAVNGFVTASEALGKFIASGEIRAIASTEPVLPQKWINVALVGHKNLAVKKPEMVKKGVKVTLQAAAFVNANPDWVTNQLARAWGYQGQTARLLTAQLRYGTSGITDPEAVENVAGFLKRYGIIAKDQAVKVSELYTNAFLP